jgi:beta-N-acetylhexosaminidase
MSRRLAGALAVGPLLLTTCGPAAAATTRTTADHHPAPASRALAAYAAMTPRQRIGQLFMVGVPAAEQKAATLRALRSLHVGNVILDSNSHRSVHHVAAITSSLAAALTEAHVKPFISTDQEGGEVQRLTGSGFSAMPSALRQGRLLRHALRLRATTWGRQLAAAGVNLNLAPVADTVPSPHAALNQPIGRYHREYGHTPGVVAHHVVAVVRGETAAGIAVAVKHFPGLGRATGNTDLSRRVTDPTTRHDPYLQPFQAAVDAGAQFVMVSLATYPHIDAGRAACFSPTVMTTMLRHALGFRGVIISDSFNARAIARVPPAQQAVNFFRAGGTMLLDTDPTPLRRMERAVAARAAAKPHFASIVKSAVLLVLTAKAKANLLPSTG